VIQSFAEGETIVERGEIISAEDIEALQELGLAQPEDRWQDMAGAIALIVLSISILIVYLRRHPEITNDLRGLTLITILFLLFVSAARSLIPGHVVVPYLYPIPAFALIVAALYGDQIALTLTIPLVLLTTYALPNTIELTLFYALSSIFGVLIPKQTQRITAYLWVGTTIAASGAVTITAYRLMSSDVDWLGMATLAGAAVVNGVVSAGLAVLLQYFLAPLLGMTTPLQLIELSRPDHPLLEYLLRHAPGTYQHSLQVANLAEQAAESIDADSLLTRVGALYHDVGKTQNPQFFIENQIAGPLNPHDDLDPAESAAIIIRHVADGIELTQEHKLPRRIQDFVSEHHGTMQTHYQLTQALNAAGGDADTVDKSLFEYKGPRPQSRETALVMLADGCEARVRSQHPADEEELREIIRDTVNNRLTSGQLDDTSLTLQDINTIIDSFTATLRGIYHPRVEYPTLDQTTQRIPRITIEAPEETEPTEPTESQSSP
jgi:putative nucleotidyltransferase with HDIG domain